MPKFTKIYITGKVPERPLSETERLAVAMGFIQCQFAEVKPRVRWCGESKRLTQPEFARVWSAACTESDELTKQHPGAFFWPNQEWQDTPFLTGNIL